MQEKTRHRFNLLWEFCLALFVGCFALLIAYAKGAPIWLEVLIAIFFIGVGIFLVLSPRFRRYMQKQQVYSHGVPEYRLVDKYTLLEDEFEKIRAASAEAMCAEYHPRFSLREWPGKRWDAIPDEERSELVWVLFPGMFRDMAAEQRVNEQVNGTGEFCVEACVAALWNGREWDPSPMFFPGDEQEAASQLKAIMKENGGRV